MTLKKIILCLIGTFLISTLAFAEHKPEPIYKDRDTSCSIWGYSNMSVSTKQDLMATHIRIRSGCTYKNWTFFIENNLAGLDHRLPANYITQAWGGYTFKDALVSNDMFSNTTIRAGSILTAGGRYLPPAFMGVTVTPPTDPFGAFGYGIQVQTNIIPDVTFIADVTGTTGKAYNDPARTSRFETSQRIEWTAIKHQDGKPELNLSLTNQWSDEFQRIGLSTMWLPTEKLGLYGGVFRADEHTDFKKRAVSVGGYALIDYRVWKMDNNKLDLRTHVKFEKVSGSTDYTGYTGGLRGGLSLGLPEDGGYGRIGGSNVTFDVTRQSTKINDGPTINETIPAANIRVFF